MAATTTLPLSAHHISIIDKSIPAKDPKLEMSQNVLTGLVKTLLNGLLTGAQGASSYWGGATAFKYAVKSDPKILKAKHVALEKLGLGGTNLSQLLHTIIDPAKKQLLEDKEIPPEIKKLLDTMPELSDSVETLLTTIFANLADRAILNQKTPPASAPEMLNAILLYVAGIAEKHISGSANQNKQSLVDSIALLEAAEKKENSKDIAAIKASGKNKPAEEAAIKEALKKNENAKIEGMSNLLKPMIDDLLKAALPKGLESAGLNFCSAPSFIQSKVTDFLISKGATEGAKFYFANFESVETAQDRLKQLSSSKDGALLVQTVETGANTLFKTYPLLSKLNGLGKFLANSFISKLIMNLSTDQTKPVESAVSRLQGILVKFYEKLVEKREEFMGSYFKLQKLKQELTTCQEAKDANAAQKKSRQALIEKLQDQIKAAEKEGNDLFMPLSKDLWTAAGIDKDPLFKMIAGKPEKLAAILHTQFDNNLMSNPALIKWIFPQHSNETTKAEIEKLGLGKAVTPMVHAISHLITAPAKDLIKLKKDEIAKQALGNISALLPFLSPRLQAYMQEKIASKLDSIASNPIDKDLLWQFIEANIEGVALEIIKGVAGNEEQAELIKGLGAMASGGKLQNVLDILNKMGANLKEPIEKFHLEHGKEIAKTRIDLLKAREDLQIAQAAFLKANEADKKSAASTSDLEDDIALQNAALKELEANFNRPFEKLSDLLLKQTGLDKVFASGNRLTAFGIDTLIRQQLLGVSDAIYQQIALPKKEEKPITKTTSTTVGTAPTITLKPISISADEFLKLAVRAIDIAGKHISGKGDPKKPTLPLSDLIVAIETSDKDDNVKKQEIAEIFRPIVNALYEDKEIADAAAPIIQALMESRIPPELKGIIGTAAGTLNTEFIPMLPSILANVYPMLMGTFSDALHRKEMLNATAEGRILMEGVKKGSKNILGPVLNTLLRKLVGDSKADFKDNPLFINLEGFGSVVAETLLSNLFLKLAANDTEHPLQSIIARLQDLLGTLYKQNALELKQAYIKHLELQDMLNLAKQSPFEGGETERNTQISKLQKQIEEEQANRQKLLAPLIERIWNATGMAEEPPLNLVPDEAKKLFPALVTGAFNSLVESQPGLLKLIDPEQGNKQSRKALEDIPNGRIFVSTLDTVTLLASAPLPGLLTAQKDAIAHAAVKGITEFLPMTDVLKDSLQHVIAKKLQNVAHNNILEAPPHLSTVTQVMMDELSLIPNIPAVQRKKVQQVMNDALEKYSSQHLTDKEIAEKAIDQINGVIELEPTLQSKLQALMLDKLQTISLQKNKKTQAIQAAIDEVANIPYVTDGMQDRIRKDLADKLLAIAHRNPTNEALADEMAELISHHLEMAPALKAQLRNGILNKLEIISNEAVSNDPIWKFAKSNVEGVILDIFRSMEKSGADKKKVALGRALVQMAFGGTAQAAYNPLEAITDNLLDIVADFHENHEDAVKKDYDKDYALIEKARAQLKQAAAELGENPSPDHKAIFNAQRDALSQKEDAFYARYQPLADVLVKETGLETMLDSNQKLGIFGLDKVIKKQLLVLCGMVYNLGFQSGKAREAATLNLSIQLYDPKHAARVAKGQDAKAAKLQSAGIRLDSVDIARQKEILDASDASTLADFVEQGNELLADVIEIVLKEYLSTHGEEISHEINREVLGNRLSSEKDLPIIADAIQRLASGKNKGTKALFKLLHHELAVPLTKALTNLLQASPTAIKAAKGQHGKELLPMNVIVNLLGTMKEEIHAITHTQAFKAMQKKIDLKELELKNVKGTPQEKVVKKELETLQWDLGVHFDPLTKKIFAMVGGKDKKISDPEHPLHDVQLIPESLREKIWNTVLVKTISQVISNHYLVMTPKTEDLEEQLRKLTGNNVVKELCRILTIVIHDTTPLGLAQSATTLGDNLTKTIQGAFKKIPDDAPPYLKNLQSTFNDKQELIKQVFGSLFNALGTSKLDVFKNGLWPLLQKMSYPILLQFVTKIFTKIKEIDSPQLRTELAVDIMELLSVHAQISNAATVAAKKKHAYQVPVDKMLTELEKGGQLHPVLKEVLEHPENEFQIRKKYFSDATRKLLSKIGFTKEDLPFVENKLAFQLIIDEIGPLAFALGFDSLIGGDITKPGGNTLMPIEGDMINFLSVNTLVKYQNTLASAKTLEQKKEMLANLPPQMQAFLPESFRSQVLPDITLPKMKFTKFDDAYQVKLEKHVAQLLLALKARVPDQIAQLEFIKPILEASAKDIAAALREMVNDDKNTLTKFGVWLSGLSTYSLIPGEHDLELDMYKTYERAPVFKPKSSTPEQKVQRKEQLMTLSTGMVSTLISQSIVDWYNSVIDGFAEAFNLGLKDIYTLIDRKTKDKVLSTAFKDGIKKICWGIGWFLFVATIVPGIIFLVAKYYYVPKRVRANIEDVHSNVLKADNRNAAYLLTDRVLGGPLPPYLAT